MRDGDSSGIRFQETENVLQGNGFSHAAAAKDAHGFGRIDFEADIVENAFFTECLRDVAELDIRS